MKLPTFKRDTAALRRQVLEETSQAASRLAQLGTERQAVLIEADSLDAVKRIDDEIAALERTVTIHQDRLRALAGQLKDERQAQREQDRASQIAVIEKKLAGREVLAEKLEQAIKDAGDAYFALTSYPSPLISDWHFPLPRGYRQIDLNGINREVSLALYSASRPIEGKPRMPSASSLDSGVAGIKSETISGVVARQNRDLVELLRVMSLGDDSEVEAA
jgi:hypothetical protein